ncbi:MAG TPA: hypothetical protein VNO32_19785 [Candidatus Acidoferrum sp.]|nr:hypothetical protein [Candidatus Acidoferrum sp.]
MRTDVVYAKTEEGVELAVIDVTHPAFRVTATEAELAAMAAQYVLEAGKQQEVPAALQEALRNSMLGRGLMAAMGTFLDGTSTYLLKLGPENLGVQASPIDKRIAASFPAFAARVRLQDMARLLADGLVRAAAVEPRRPLCLVNIGGGTGSDSWNAVIRLQGEQGELLVGREIRISVMDLDARGPGFGGRAIAALCAAEGPLRGLKVGFRHFSYEWSDAERLRKLLCELQAGDAACGVSSEGGLFEYGSDEEIVSNLRAVDAGTPRDAVVVGSVTRDGRPVRASLIASRVLTRPRTIEGFRSLCEQGGWTVEESMERPFSYNVRLVKA